MSDVIQSAEIDTPAGKLKVSGANLNTLFTVLGFIISCVIAWTLFAHQQDSKESGREFVGAIKEQTQTMKESQRLQREQNCLMYARKDFDPELCRRLSQ